MEDLEGRILENRLMAPGYQLIRLKLEREMKDVRPGQFVMLKIPSNDVFLRRPLSIFAYRKQILTLLYKTVGTGTSYLSRMKRGGSLMVLGPLGNGFTVARGMRPVLVAGGIGIAGVYFLWRRLRGRADVFYGCTNQGELALLHEIARFDPMISTRDGSSGCTGNVVELLSQSLPSLPRQIQLFACGPMGMFKSLRALLEQEKRPCQVLVEERMACGLGLCYGCVTKTTDEKEPYKRVCKEGPVFDLWQLSL